MPHGHGSGIDWTMPIHVVVERFAHRLEMVQYLLNHIEPHD